MHILTSLFRFLSDRPQPSLDTRLKGPRVVLRQGDPTDWQAWRAIRETSRDFLVPWEPSWPHNALTYGFFCRLLRRHAREWRQRRTYSFLVFLHGKDKGDTLIGGITLNDVQRGVAQKGTLGYWIGEPYAQQGLMTEAVELICNFAFEILQLHRVEASCLPRNVPSQKLLQRLGFEEEGFAKAYLQINGRWEDHLLWGKTRQTH